MEPERILIELCSLELSISLFNSRNSHVSRLGNSMSYVIRNLYYHDYVHIMLF